MLGVSNLGFTPKEKRDGGRAEHSIPGCGVLNPTALDRHYEAIRVEMSGAFQEVG
jgi:hypothetical protein